MKVKSLTESLERLIENKYVEKEPSNILEAIDNILGKLNEAEMSPEDARDTELLKSARHKIAGKKTNAKNLTPEEQEVLAKYGLDAWGYKGETKLVTPGKTELFQGNDHYGQPGYGWGRSNSDSFSEPKDSWNGRSVRSSRGGNYDKANFADRARKLDARAGNQPYKDLEAARHTDEISMRSKYGIDRIRSAKATADYHADALRDLDNAEAEAKAQAQQKYDNTMERIADQEERQQAVKQKAQDRIDAILAKHRKEVVESLQHFLRTLNEANMSDEDRRDSEIIKDITLKLMKRRNAKLTDEERAILDKYGITNTSGVLRTAGGKIMPRPDHNLRPGRASELVSRAHRGDNLDKVNLADYARKADGREAKRKEMYAPYWDDHTAINHDAKNIDSRYDSGSTQRQARIRQTADMAKDYDDMTDALGDRKRADLNITQLQKDRGDALEQKRRDEKRAESRTVSNREYHTDRLKKHTAEKDRLIAAKKAQFSKKNESLNETVETDVVRLQRYSKVDPDKYGGSREWITLKVKPLNEFTDGDIKIAMKTSFDGSVRMTDKYDHMVVWQQLSDSLKWAMQHQDLYTMDAIKAHCGINESFNESLADKFIELHDEDDYLWNLHGTDYSFIYDELAKYLKPGETWDDPNISLRDLFERMPQKAQQELYNKLAAPYNESLKEGAEGRQRKGYKWIIYQDKEPYKIVAVRSTHTEAQAYILKHLDKDLTCDEVEEKYAIKGRNYDQDLFEGCKRKSLKENSIKDAYYSGWSFDEDKDCVKVISVDPYKDERIKGVWTPDTYQVGYNSIEGKVSDDVMDYIDEWSSFDNVFGVAPDGTYWQYTDDDTYCFSNRKVFEDSIRYNTEYEFEDRDGYEEYEEYRDDCTFNIELPKDVEIYLEEYELPGFAYGKLPNGIIFWETEDDNIFYDDINEFISDIRYNIKEEAEVILPNIDSYDPTPQYKEVLEKAINESLKESKKLNESMLTLYKWDVDWGTFENYGDDSCSVCLTDDDYNTYRVELDKYNGNWEVTSVENIDDSTIYDSIRLWNSNIIKELKLNESLNEDKVPDYGFSDYYHPSKKEVDTARQYLVSRNKHNNGRLSGWCRDKLYFRNENGNEISADRDSSLVREPDKERAFRAFLKKNYPTWDEWDDDSYEDALDAFGESLNEAAGNVRIVETGLSGDFGKEIIDSIIGQMSDGIWENAPYMEYYWPNVDATDNGDIEVSTDWTSKWNQRENKFRNMSDQEVRKFFANKLKAIVQEYLNDTNTNPYTGFRADNEEVCSYLGGHVVEDITVGQAYEAYNILRK